MRGMTLGHVEIFWSNDDVAVMAGAKDGPLLKDATIRCLREGTRSRSSARSCSPGLLARLDSGRNEIELLSLAAMQHLPTAVMYVMNLSSGAGDRF